MSIKRRDNINRILRNGESQSKDGKYRFTFYENGTQKCFYTWDDVLAGCEGLLEELSSDPGICR